MSADTVTLYHYTCFRHYLHACTEGEIRTTETEVGSPTAEFFAERGCSVDPVALTKRFGDPAGEHVGPDVVWLTTSPTVEPIRSSLVTRGASIEEDKTRVRLTIDLSRTEVERWDIFARRHRINPKWHRALTECGRGSASHYIIERPIRWDEVIEVAFDRELSLHVDAHYPEMIA